MSIEMVTAIGAFLVGIGSVISALLLNRKTTALLEYRLGKVEEKLDSHNGYAEKFADTAEDLSELKADIRVIKNDLKWLKEEKA